MIKFVTVVSHILRVPFGKKVIIMEIAFRWNWIMGRQHQCLGRGMRSSDSFLVAPFYLVYFFLDRINLLSDLFDK